MGCVVVGGEEMGVGTWGLEMGQKSQLKGQPEESQQS